VRRQKRHSMRHISQNSAHRRPIFRNFVFSITFSNAEHGNPLPVDWLILGQTAAQTFGCAAGAGNEKARNSFTAIPCCPIRPANRSGGYRPALHAADTSTVASSSHVMNLAAVRLRITKLAAQLEPAEMGFIFIAKGSGMLGIRTALMAVKQGQTGPGRPPDEFSGQRGGGWWCMA